MAGAPIRSLYPQPRRHGEGKPRRRAKPPGKAVDGRFPPIDTRTHSSSGQSATRRYLPDAAVLARCTRYPSGDQRGCSATPRSCAHVPSAHTLNTCAGSLSWGRHALFAGQGAEELAKDGFDFEVIDLRTLFPYDWNAVKSVDRKTRRVIFVNEDTSVTNFGEHLIRRTVEELFTDLDVAPRLLAGKNVPGVGLAPVLEEASVPQPQDVENAMRALALDLGVRRRVARP